MLHEYSLDAGALAAIAEQFNGVLASHAIILAEAMLSVYLAEKPIVDRNLLLESTRRPDLRGGCRLAPSAQSVDFFGRHIGVLWFGAARCVVDITSDRQQTGFCLRIVERLMETRLVAPYPLSTL